MPLGSTLIKNNCSLTDPGHGLDTYRDTNIANHGKGFKVKISLATKEDDTLILVFLDGSTRKVYHHEKINDGFLDALEQPFDRTFRENDAGMHLDITIKKGGSKKLTHC